MDEKSIHFRTFSVDENGNPISPDEASHKTLLCAGLGQVIKQVGPNSELGKVYQELQKKIASQEYETFMSNLLKDPRAAEELVNMLNPVEKTTGKRLVPGSVETIEDLNDINKVAGCVAYLIQTVSGLKSDKDRAEENIAKLNKTLENQGQQISELESNLNKKDGEYIHVKKASKIKNWFIVGLAVLTLALTGHTVASGIKNSSLESEKETLVQERNALQKQIDEAKDALMKLLDYNADQAKDKSINDLINDYSKMIEKNQSEEINKAYEHFVDLLSELGLKLEDCVDSDGNFSVENFDKNVQSIVKEAINNLEELRKIDDKINIILSNCDIQKIDEDNKPVFDKDGNPVYYKSTEDFESLADALDVINNHLASLEENSDIEIKLLESQVEGLRQDLDKANENVESLTNEVDALKKQLEELQNKETPNGNESSDKDDSDPNISPVSGGDKDENGQEHGSGDNGRGNDSGNSEEDEYGRDL